MEFPEKIPILRIEDYHTHYIGKYNDDNQFWGYSVFVFSQQQISDKKNWQQYRREYAILYLFDKEGNFTGTEYKYAGTTNSIQFNIELEIENMISKLSKPIFCNIEVKPFQIEIDGFLFGLIPNKESKMIELQPSSTIAFYEPWDGEYWT